MTPNLRHRLVWLVGGRAAVVTLLLVAAILTQVRAPGSAATDPFFVLIGLTYALTAVYALLLRQAERRPWLVDAQLMGDALIVSSLVQITGGVASYFSSLYTLPIIAASTIQSRASGLIVGVLSSVLYVAILSAQYQFLGMPRLPFGGVESLPLGVALFIAGLNIFGFVAVAVLSGYLAERAQRTGAELEQASHRIAGLQAFGEYVISSLTSGLATTDLDGKVLSFNRAAETITGIAAADAVGAPAKDVLGLPAEFAELFTGAPSRRPRLPRVEYGYTCADRRTIELGISTAILATPVGENGFVFTFQDVTEARRQEREARAQQRLAAVGEMAAGIAHEIRNPLASMSGSLQILRQELPLSDEQSQLMDIVLRESDRLNETIRSFLAYARPQRRAAMRMDVRRVVTDTATLLQNSPELLPSHTVRTDVPAEPAWCLADEAQMRQVVWNLATNGLRAMAGGGELLLQVVNGNSGPQGSRGVTIAVQDEGIGIAADELDGILQPFRGSFERGSGLGLSIVHRIVSDYGGELQVRSQPGLGTTVTVKLPASSQLPASSSQLKAES